MPSDVRSLLFGTEIASLYVQPHIGGDLALFTGVAKCVLERHAEDRAFIEGHTEGFDVFRESVASDLLGRDCTSDQASTAPRIERIAECYIAAKNAVIGWTMGITHHLHGTQNVQAIANLALLRGMVGRPAGLMPIRGHSNVQGMGSVGVTPALKQAVLERFERRLGVQPPKSPGYDTMACMEAAGRGEMDVAICLGGNLFGSNPDARFAAEALSENRPGRLSFDHAQHGTRVGRPDAKR